MTKGEKISCSLKRHYRIKKTIKDAKAVGGLVVIIATVAILLKLVTPTSLADYQDRHNFLPKNEDKIMTVQEMIVYHAQRSGVDIESALRIAHCESRFNPKAKSSISSASGLYQFINRTWEHYCEGDRFNAEDNIKCFMKLYPNYPHWWQCK